MTKLKLGALVDDKPVKLTVELPAQVYRDLVAYSDVLLAESGQTVEPTKLIGLMLARFMATDRLSRRRGAILCRSLNRCGRPDKGAVARPGGRHAAGSRIAAAPDCRCGRASRR